jgi:hypothetical protein
MSKKKKKQRTTDQQVSEQEPVIQDDPYWKISGMHVDPHRFGRFLHIFKHIEHRHPEWTEDLLDGTPTYYCVLGVQKRATKDQVEHAFETKRDLSSYPDKVIKEAFEVLSSQRLRKEYDKLLVVFEQITKCMPTTEKIELVERHRAQIDTENEYVRMQQILQTYKWYYIFYMKGMPDLYEIMGLAPDASMDEIQAIPDMDPAFNGKVLTILGDQSSREDYDFILSFTNKYLNELHIKEREARKKKWKQIDTPMLEIIVLTALSEPDAVAKYMTRRAEILNMNEDWKQYLPPYELTFFSVLGVDKDSLSGDKKEIERMLREKYRHLEKTTQVNLSYTVLKNTSKRDDYLWLIENNEMLTAIDDLVSEDKKAFETANIRGPTGPDIEEIMEMIVHRFLEDEETDMKASKKKKVSHIQTTIDSVLEE